jgi:hypothetical protein
MQNVQVILSGLELTEKHVTRLEQDIPTTLRHIIVENGWPRRTQKGF